MLDAGFAEAVAQGVQGIMEGAEHDDLFLALEDLVDEGEAADELGDEREAAPGGAGGEAVGLGPLEQGAGGVGGGNAEGLELGAQGGLAVAVEVFGL